MRPYFMTTADFRSFSAPRLLFDPGESAIDTTLFRAPPSAVGMPPVGMPPQSALYAVFKSEQNECARWRWDAGGELRANPNPRPHPYPNPQPSPDPNPSTNTNP